MTALGCGPQMVPPVATRVDPLASAQLVVVVGDAVMVALAMAPVVDVAESAAAALGSVAVALVAPASSFVDAVDGVRPRSVALPPAQPVAAAAESTLASARQARRTVVFGIFMGAGTVATAGAIRLKFRPCWPSSADRGDCREPFAPRDVCGSMSYRTTASLGVTAPVRVPFHSHRADAISAIIALAVALLYTAHDFTGFRLRFDHPVGAAAGTCTVTRLSRLHAERVSVACSSVVVEEDPDHLGGYLIDMAGADTRSGAVFRVPPVANSGAGDRLVREVANTMRTVEAASEPTATPAWHVESVLVSRKSAWIGWSAGVLIALMFSAIARRWHRETVVRIGRDGTELQWGEAQGALQAIPIAAIERFDIDQEDQRPALVAMTANGRTVVAYGPLRALVSARDALERATGIDGAEAISASLVAIQS